MWVFYYDVPSGVPGYTHDPATAFVILTFSAMAIVPLLISTIDIGRIVYSNKNLLCKG